MTDLAPSLRAARAEDAAVLAQLVNEAGEGLPLYLWDQLAEPGQSAWDVGASRALRESGGFSFTNATVIETGGAVAGCLIGYEIPERPEPIAPDMPAIFRPLQELENLAPDTWYVNVLAILPDHRGQTFGTRLLEHAEAMGRDAGKPGMSVIVADSNAGARRLYERFGYREAATRTMVKEDWQSSANAWVLLTKRL